MKTLSKLCLVFVLIFAGLSTVRAQNSLKNDKAMKADEVKGFVNGQNYVFEATHTDSKKGDMPLKYHKYDVAISKDTLIAYLPGKNGPVKFDCTNFAYNAMRGKSGSWDVVIKPKTNMSDVKQLKLDISPQGHASLRVIRNNHGPLELDGYIKQEDY
jgi:hypothetical protein